MQNCLQIHMYRLNKYSAMALSMLQSQAAESLEMFYP